MLCLSLMLLGCSRALAVHGQRSGSSKRQFVPCWQVRGLVRKGCGSVVGRKSGKQEGRYKTGTNCPVVSGFLVLERERITTEDQGSAEAQRYRCQ